MLKRPKTGASVSTTPIRFRFCFSTVQIARTNSYSTGVPRSMNGSTDLLQAAGHGHGQEDLVGAVGPVDDVRHALGRDAVALLGKVGHRSRALRVVDLHFHHVAGAGLQLAERARAGSSGSASTISGTLVLTKASMRTGRLISAVW